MANPIYIIPARGGSKGIPRKNIKLLGGRPLISYTIDCALRAGAPAERIILSTDDVEIANVARGLGLPVGYMRPAHLGADHIGSREVILDAMDYADAAGIEYDCVILLQPTSPFRRPEDITNALSLYNGDVDMVVSVNESSANPYYNLFETEPVTGYLKISKGSGLYTRRQDVPAVWQYNGAVYVINPRSIRAMSMGEFPRRVPYVMNAELSLDLDTPSDWALAENIMSQLNNAN